MKKLALIILSTILLNMPALAEQAMNIPMQINHRIYSTQAAQPLNGLEQNYYTNSAIRQIENKHKTQIQTSNNDSDNTPVNTTEEKKSLKGLFKGFRIIY